MKYVLLFIISLVVTHMATAHPSWGIVADANGNIYLADVMHHGDGALAKIDATHRQLTIIQDDIHVHNITADSKGNIWGAADIWHTGSIEGEGHHYIVKYHPGTGVLDTLLFTDDEDTFFGNNFALNEQTGAVYFTIHNKIFTNDMQGHVRQVIDHEFGFVNTFTADRENNLWIADRQKDNGTLYIWNEQEGLKVYATNLLPPGMPDPIFEEHNHQRLYHIAFTPGGIPLLCDNATRTLRKIPPGGTADTLYHSPPGWHPIGICTDGDKYYMMESGWNKNGHMGPRILIFDKEFRKLELLEIDMDNEKITTTGYTTEDSPENKKSAIPIMLLGGVLVLAIIAAVVRRSAAGKRR